MKSAVLVIDVQSAIFDSTPKPFEGELVVGRINSLIKQAKENDIPIFYIQHEIPGYLEHNSGPWQLKNNLVVKKSGIFVRKTTGDSFLRSDLEEKLKSLEITDLLICGYASEICVDTTTRRATGLGYTVQLISDAHTTHDKEHLSALKIREHHNITLSMAPTITLVNCEDVQFNGKLTSK